MQRPLPIVSISFSTPDSLQTYVVQQPTVVLLKEGTDTSQGKGQLLSNISACLVIAETLASTLGPRGMDKLIVNDRGEAQITNDGATILKLLDIVHPAARTLVDIARAQDAEVGDGTTSVVLLAAQLLKEVKGYIEEGVSPHIIMKGFRQAAQLVRAFSHLLVLLTLSLFSPLIALERSKYLLIVRTLSKAIPVGAWNLH